MRKIERERKLKIFRVDTSLKYINFELDGKQYSIHFRSNARKGIYDVSVWIEGRETSVKIMETYPSLKIILVELWRIHFPLWLKFKVRQRYKNQLTDKDLHCIARMLQSVLFAENIFYGCNFCKYKNECFQGNTVNNMNDTHVRKKLQEITGINLDLFFNRNNPEAKFKK